MSNFYQWRKRLAAGNTVAKDIVLKLVLGSMATNWGGTRAYSVNSGDEPIAIVVRNDWCNLENKLMVTSHCLYSLHLHMYTCLYFFSLLLKQLFAIDLTSGRLTTKLAIKVRKAYQKAGRRVQQYKERMNSAVLPRKQAFSIINIKEAGHGFQYY